MPVISLLRSLKQVDCHEFEIDLAYQVKPFSRQIHKSQVIIIITDNKSIVITRVTLLYLSQFYFFISS